MAKNQQLGIFWSRNTFHFVETERNTITKLFSSPFQLLYDITSSAQKETPEALNLVSIIQKALRDQQITSSEVNFALPAQDIIFRTFIIPWMQSSEVKGVVEFEVSKYIPFKLDDLSYAYDTIPITDNRRKKMRVLFVAIRKTVIENYCRILERAGLQVNIVEPSFMSLIRALIFKKLLPGNKTVAVIEADHLSGRIIIVEKNVPQFVREFQLSLPKTQGTQTPDSLQARLFNEIRISLDYYRRQAAHSNVEKIFVLENESHVNFDRNLEEYISIPTTLLNVNSMLNTSRNTDSGALSAFGVCLRDTVAKNVNFDLSYKETAGEKIEGAAGARTNYTEVAITAFVCLCIIFFVFKFKGNQKVSFQKQIKSLTEKIGRYEFTTAEMLHQQTQEINNKLNGYKEIPAATPVSTFLALVPKELPEGVWLNSFAVKCPLVRMPEGSRQKIDLNFNGYSYSADANQQVLLINTFVQNLRTNQVLSGFFKNIELVSVSRQNLQGYPVTAFLINCK
ncbi:MAG: pilus assembly protein PilM [Candidatus Omnitrophota bacterium]